MTTTQATNYSYEDYLIFLLMHCGFVDAELTANEDFHISQLGTPDQIKRIKRDYAQADEAKKMHLLQEFQMKHCQKEEDQIKALKLARGLFEADYRLSQYETQFYQQLQNMLRR